MLLIRKKEKNEVKKFLQKFGAATAVWCFTLAFIFTGLAVVFAGKPLNALELSEPTVYEVATVEELRLANENSIPGDTIKLINHIELNNDFPAGHQYSNFDLNGFILVGCNFCLSEGNPDFDFILNDSRPWVRNICTFIDGHYVFEQLDPTSEYTPEKGSFEITGGALLEGQIDGNYFSGRIVMNGGTICGGQYGIRAGRGGVIINGGCIYGTDFRESANQNQEFGGMVGPAAIISSLGPSCSIEINGGEISGRLLWYGSYNNYGVRSPIVVITPVLGPHIASELVGPENSQYNHYYMSSAHEYPDDWEITHPATCASTGTRSRKCTICDQEETEIIPATGEHTYGAWEIVSKPTTEAAGEKKQSCTVCGQTVTAEIAKLESTDAGEPTKDVPLVPILAGVAAGVAVLGGIAITLSVRSARRL